MLKEFKEFAVKGNAFDLAVGIIIGAAFGAIVTSMVNDILMPPLGMLTRGLDFKDLFLALNGQQYASLAVAKQSGAPVIAYGAFLNTVINFLLVGFAVFLMAKEMNRLRKSQPASAAFRECPYCLSTIPAKAIRCAQCTSQVPNAAVRAIDSAQASAVWLDSKA